VRDKQDIDKKTEAFIEAFQKGDAKAVAAFWTMDSDYTDQTGHTLKGRDAIEGAFKKQFAATKGAKLRITATSLRFLKDDIAIEDGTTELVYGNDAPPTTARYTAIHVKQDGNWYLASVREAVYVAPSNHG